MWEILFAFHMKSTEFNFLNSVFFSLWKFLDFWNYITDLLFYDLHGFLDWKSKHNFKREN